MLRRAALVTFVSAVVLVVACGRQITPNPSTSNLAGKIDLRFRVNGQLEFSTYDYQVVIDTCGQGVPYPNPATNSYKNYSYSFNVGTSPFGVAQVSPILIQYLLTTGTSGLNPQIVPLNPSFFSLNTNSNTAGIEFELIFDRELLDNPKTVPQPCPEFTQPPAATAALRPSAGAGIAPLIEDDAGLVAVAEAATPVPVASITPGPMPTIPIQSTWRINFIVLTPAGVPLDSLGQGGPSDVSYPGITVDTQSSAQIPVLKQPGISASDPSAAIAGGEVDNYP